MKVRWKLVAILLVPLAALGLLGYVGVRDRQDTVDAAHRISAAVAVAERASTLADALERESIASAAYVASGQGELADAVTQARAATDAAAASFVEVDAGSVEPEVWADATRAVDSIQVLRGAVDDGIDPSLVSVTTFFQAITTIRAAGAPPAADPTAANSLRAYEAIGDTKQHVAHQLAFLSAAGHGLELELSHLVALRNAASDAAVQTEVFNSLAGADDKLLLRRTVSGPATVVLDEAADAVANGDSAALAELQVTELAAALQALDAYREVERSIEAEVAALATAQADAARNDARSFLYLVLAIAGFALLSASILGRAISGPLNRLTRAARRVADEQLPALVETLRSPTPTEAPELAPVLDKAGRDEIGELARAFEAIQRTAVDVAVEQAGLLRKGIGELFVNLARRNQSLLDRQIGYLDELEAAETDPDALEHLFKLDHLATRMRRNAESLLVLAGIDTPRRWSRPVPLVDVARAAIGEVEQFARVELGPLPEVMVQGLLAADMAHVLAELLDNATQFSAPSTVVTVTARTTAGGIEIEIADEGIGMSDEQLAEANAVLAEPPLNGLSLSRSLGFIVVGRLAERHQVEVQLTASPLGTGVVATVGLPHTVMVGETPANPAPVEASGPYTSPAWTTPPAPAALAAEPAGELPAVPAPSAPAPAPAATAAVPAASEAQRPAAEVARPIGRPDDVPVDLWARLVGHSTIQWDDEPTRHGAQWPPAPARATPAASEALTGPAAEAPASLTEAIGEPGLLVAEIHEHLGTPVNGHDHTLDAAWDREPDWAQSDPWATVDEPPVVEPDGWGAAPSAPAAAPPAPADPATWAPLGPVEPVPAGPATTAGGLPRRRATRHSSVTAASASSSPDGDGAVASQRSPAEIRSLLSNYRSGLARGRGPVPGAAGSESPDPEGAWK